MDQTKLWASWLFVAFAFMIGLSSPEAGPIKKIGVLMFNEEARFNESQNGTLDQLKEDGFGDTAVKFTMGNAAGSKARAAELVRQFAEAKMDLIITVGTAATLAITREIKDVPVVFSLVYDPVEAGISKGWQSSENNTTGMSPRVPMSKLIDSLMAFAPIKRLAVFYMPGEKYTEILVKELQGLQAEYHIKVIPIPVTKKEEVAQIMPEIVRTTDAIYISGSSIIYASVPMIVDMATKAKVITITHIEELVEKGALMGICIDPYRMGRLAGKKAVKILKGAKPSSIPIEVEKKFDIMLNKKTARAGQFQIPPAFMEKVTKTIE